MQELYHSSELEAFLTDSKALIDMLHRLQPLKSIVCTQFHVDHVAGCINLKQLFTDCEI